MASEEFLTFDLSFVWDWALASSSSERSSSGKGTLQYWNELNVQSSVVLSASASSLALEAVSEPTESSLGRFFEFEGLMELRRSWKLAEVGTV